ncbi:MAG TPA: DNA polymerase Y family protein [Steroidobacteraceae bacterium]|nr:DNA polymerase Y family protein [Steroidobacteraceae bacterium]
MKIPAATLELFTPLPPPARKPLRTVPQARGHSPARQLWMAIHFPQLALEALERDVDERRPHAVIDGSGSAQRVAACDRAAARAGVCAGMALNAAIALAPRLMARPRQRNAEQWLLERCAAWAGQFTPLVSLEPPDALLLEVKGSLGLFEGAAALSERISGALGSRGLSACVTLAPTPRASLWLARSGRNAIVMEPAALTGALADLPVRSLGWSEAILELLAAMGVYTVGDCLRLPRAGWAQRFGAELLEALDEATGRTPQIRRGYQRAQRFNARFEPAAEVSETERLAVALEPLLEALGRFLRGRQGGISSFVIGLRHRRAAESILRVGLAAPSADARHFMTLARARLERHGLPEPVTELRLRSGAVLPMGFTSGSIFRATKAAPEGTGGVPRLVERLRARLGEAAVFGVCLVPEHRPEAAWRKAQLAADAIVRAHREPVEIDAVRPLWMLTQPEALKVADDGPRYRGPLVIESGPERIETGWWDGKDIARDYYIARDSRGVRLWIYQERRAPGGWFWHGIFG